jgi:glycosyltransferase involved in cell wall biosynthesis
MKKLGVLLPAYNEEKNIRIVIREVKNLLPNAKIVVVDDGSTDRTYELAKREKVVVLRHNVNKGKGEALKTGLNFFRKFKVNYVIIADADRQYTIKDAPKFLEALKNFDLVMGFRIPSHVPYANRLGNFMWRKLFNFFFSTKLKDSNCGYIGLNEKALKRIKNIHGGYIIENAILVEAIRKGLKVAQVPVRVKYGKRRIAKFARMFFGVLFFIIKEGLKFKLERI